MMMYESSNNSIPLKAAAVLLVVACTAFHVDAIDHAAVKEASEVRCKIKLNSYSC